MKNIVEFFKAEDFLAVSENHYVTIQTAGRMAAIANRILGERGNRVYGGIENELGWTTSEFQDKGTDTHTAILVAIQPIKKECQHVRTVIWEPHLAGARKCQDCEMIYNPNMGGWYKECKHEPKNPKLIEADTCGYFRQIQAECRHCGISILAEWKPAETKQPKTYTEWT